MKNQLERVKKELDNLSESLRLLELTQDDKRFLDLCSDYKSGRKRIHNEIVSKYTDLFAVIQGIRKVSILGVQNVEILVRSNEVNCKNWIKRYNALNPLVIKYIDVFDEIICLIENGFPDGAMQRWRTLLEYSIITIFILEQGEEIAEAYYENFLKSIDDNLRPRTNFAWAKEASCLKEEKQISISKLLENIKGINPESKRRYQVIYKFTSQSIHGSSVGINLSFNERISRNMDDMYTKNANYYSGGISTVITHTMKLILQTFNIYFDTFPDGGMDIKKHWMELFNEYVKVYKSLFEK